MQFAINYSPEAEELWRDGRIKVDLFKCPDWPDLVTKVSKVHNVYVHSSLIMWRGGMETVEHGQLERWLETTETRLINTHFALAKTDFAPARGITAEAVVDHAAQVLAPLCERFGAENIIVENVPFPPGGWMEAPLREVADPEVITEVVRRSGCGFLLDIAHAVLACEGTGRSDVKAYINALPVHALRELHVVGILPEPDEQGHRQDHFALTDDDWAMTEWALERIRAGAWRKPEVMAFEYGGVGERFAWRSDSAIIAEQAPRLYALAESV